MHSMPALVSPCPPVTETAFVLSEEPGYTIRTITAEGERMQALRLRHKVFSRELGWTGGEKK
jgi:hypothetical protein